ncbi:putative ELKS/RAB6-interacting/CAST family member [Daphnia magna]|uniref:Putative ELKS/RAB6-interacting/CAST family member n=1 Tax=Daphnia magna TaxID=35525 RepID=A0A164U3M1_9CRUS|nr:putative ELKS/RAB6-interacting/CAST family member [Daphnia magna]
MQRQKVYFDGSLLIRMKIKSSQCHNQKNPYTHTTKKESVLWQDKLKSLIQDPAHRGEHVTETWAALLETKESRIAIMERDISLLEKELLQQQQLMQQQRDHWVRSIEQSNPSTPVPRTATPSQQAAVAAAQLYRNSPVNNGQTAQHKDAGSRQLHREDVVKRLSSKNGVMKPYHREMGREGKVLNLDRGFIFHIPPFKEMFSFQNVTVAFTKLVLIDQTNTPSHYLCNPTRECSKTMADVVHIQIEELRMEIGKRDQELLAMGAKMKTLEEQHQDYQRHIAVLKESLCAKEEHYNMLQTDVEELRQRHEEKNRIIEKKTQIALQATQERNRFTAEVNEMRDHLDIRDRKINVLQRKIENLEDLLKEKDNQVDMARARMTVSVACSRQSPSVISDIYFGRVRLTICYKAMQAHHCSSEGAVSSLEEAIGDKEKQITQLREQRDRAEQEKHEERDLHEREIAEYKMKLHTLESEVEKLGVRLDRALAEKDKLEAKLESSQSELGKSKAELDRVQGDAGKSSVEWESAKQRISRYEMENERLKSENERLRHDLDRSTSTFGRTQLNVTQEAERIQEKLDKTQAELRRALAELRMNQSEWERSRAEAEQLQEKVEKSQGEIYRLKAKLENAQSEKENLQNSLFEFKESLPTLRKKESQPDVEWRKGNEFFA